MTLDLLLGILKYVGLVITGAIGFVGFYTPKNWEEYEIQPVIYVPGQEARKGQRLTKWGRRSLYLLIGSGLITLCAQVTETVREHYKESEAARQKQQEQQRAAKEKQEDRERFAREKEEDRNEFDRRLREERERYEASTAEFILLKNDLERQRMQAFEAARTAKVDLKITAPLNPLPSSPSVRSAIDDALKAIPQAVKEVAVLRNKQLMERMPLEVRAREVEEITRPHLVRIIDLFRSILAETHKKGLVTIADLGPAPMLPDQIVFSTKATNNPYGSFAENIAQTVEFSHGDRWHAYLMIGLVDSTDRTNSNWYPKLRYKDRTNTVGTIWFDPAIGDLMYASGRGGRAATSTVAVVTNVIEDLKNSRISR